jgi:hypothetical protein
VKPPDGGVAAVIGPIVASSSKRVGTAEFY